MDAFNTLRIVMGIRGFLTVVLSLFGGEEAKSPPGADEPVKVTVTRVENDGRIVIESRQRMADGAETKSLEVVTVFVQ
jgi:hypothetical protein